MGAPRTLSSGFCSWYVPHASKCLQPSSGHHSTESAVYSVSTACSSRRRLPIAPQSRGAAVTMTGDTGLRRRDVEATLRAGAGRRTTRPGAATSSRLLPGRRGGTSGRRCRPLSPGCCAPCRPADLGGPRAPGPPPRCSGDGTRGRLVPHGTVGAGP